MKKIILSLSLIIVIIVSFIFVKNYKNSTKKVTQGSINTAENSQKISATDFILKDLNGKEISLSQFKGKRVFLNFWATWCPPCRGEMPELEKVYEENKDNDLVILAVNLQENENTVKSFIDKNNYKFTVLLDLKGDVATKYNIQSIPSSFFIDKYGNIVANHLGGMNKSDMDAYIKALNK